VPSVEQVRFTTSGTEACMTAVRLARAATGRSQLLAFDGCYHGHGDPLLAGQSAGIPELSARDTLRIPYNDLAELEAAFKRHSRELAAVIVEPVAANMGVVPPAPGFLEQIRELTARHGVLLIFDEVVTGFRLGRGGAQEAFGVRPDLTTFGKIIGGGLPIGALGGPRRLMQRLAPEGDVYHGGTFAGHPLSMAAGVAALAELAARPPYERIDRLAQRLAEGLQDAARAAGVPVQANRAGSMLTVFFTAHRVERFDHAKAGRTDRFARWANALRGEGVLVPPSPYEALFVSAAHTEAQIDRVVRVSRRIFTAMGRKS
jgi:glutamate-1-semialdehyde 2,1-aminomutase